MGEGPFRCKALKRALAIIHEELLVCIAMSKLLCHVMNVCDDVLTFLRKFEIQLPVLLLSNCHHGVGAPLIERTKARTGGSSQLRPRHRTSAGESIPAACARCTSWQACRRSRGGRRTGGWGRQSQEACLEGRRAIRAHRILEPYYLVAHRGAGAARSLERASVGGVAGHLQLLIGDLQPTLLKRARINAKIFSK